MSSRWTGFFIWALVAASTAFWGIKIFAATRPVPPGAQAPQAVAANGPMERLFGAVVVPVEAPPPQHPESERFTLVGVIAASDGAAQGGFAIVQIDGQPARTWHTGATLDGNTSLLAVSKRGAEFGPLGGPTAFTLQLPEPSAAQTGSLPAAVSQPVSVQPQNGVPQPPQQQVQPQMQQVQQQQPVREIAPNRWGPPRGRQAQGGVAPSRVATPPDQQNPGDNGPQQQ